PCCGFVRCGRQQSVNVAVLAAQCDFVFDILGNQFGEQRTDFGWCHVCTDVDPCTAELGVFAADNPAQTPESSRTELRHFPFHYRLSAVRHQVKLWSNCPLQGTYGLDEVESAERGSAYSGVTQW